MIYFLLRGDNMNNVKIGSKIKQLRMINQMTQKELARCIGKTESSVRKYEKGLIEIPLNVLEEIAKALNASKQVLLADADEEESKPILASIRIENTQTTIDSLRSKDIEKLEKTTISSLHTLLCKKTKGEYLAIELSSKDIEDLISKLLLVLEIELKSSNSIVNTMLKVNRKEGE